MARKYAEKGRGRCCNENVEDGKEWTLKDRRKKKRSHEVERSTEEAQYWRMLRMKIVDASTANREKSKEVEVNKDYFVQ